MGDLEKFLSDDQVKKLEPLAITEVVDLASALEADEESVGEYLGMGGRELKALHTDVLKGLPEHVRRQFHELRSKPFAYGALDPDDEQ